MVGGVLTEYERARSADLARLLRVRSLLVDDPALVAALLERDAARIVDLQRSWGAPDASRGAARRADRLGRATWRLPLQA